MEVTLTIPQSLIGRWVVYQIQNPAWTLNELVTQLLLHHFDDADRMLQSIAEQEQLRMGDMNRNGVSGGGGESDPSLSIPPSSDPEGDSLALPSQDIT